MTKKTNSNKRRVTDEDHRIGKRIHALRIAADISQDTLGKALDPPVSFQQVQKYEKGINRVTHVRLAQIAKALGCTINDFIENGGAPAKRMDELIQFAGNPLGMRMMRSFALLDLSVQRNLVALAENVAHVE